MIRDARGSSRLYIVIRTPRLRHEFVIGRSLNDYQNNGGSVRLRGDPWRRLTSTTGGVLNDDGSGVFSRMRKKWRASWS